MHAIPEGLPAPNHHYDYHPVDVKNALYDLTGSAPKTSIPHTDTLEGPQRTSLLNKLNRLHDYLSNGLYTASKKVAQSLSACGSYLFPQQIRQTASALYQRIMAAFGRSETDMENHSKAVSTFSSELTKQFNETNPDPILNKIQTGIQSLNTAHRLDQALKEQGHDPNMADIYPEDLRYPQPSAPPAPDDVYFVTPTPSAPPAPDDLLYPEASAPPAPFNDEYTQHTYFDHDSCFPEPSAPPAPEDDYFTDSHPDNTRFNQVYTATLFSVLDPFYVNVNSSEQLTKDDTHQNHNLPVATPINDDTPIIIHNALPYFDDYTTPPTEPTEASDLTPAKLPNNDPPNTPSYSPDNAIETLLASLEEELQWLPHAPKKTQPSQQRGQHSYKKTTYPLFFTRKNRFGQRYKPSYESPDCSTKPFNSHNKNQDSYVYVYGLDNIVTPILQQPDTQQTNSVAPLTWSSYSIENLEEDVVSFTGYTQEVHQKLTRIVTMVNNLSESIQSMSVQVSAFVRTLSQQLAPAQTASDQHPDYYIEQLQLKAREIDAIQADPTFYAAAQKWDPSSTAAQFTQLKDSISQVEDYYQTLQKTFSDFSASSPSTYADKITEALPKIDALNTTQNPHIKGFALELTKLRDYLKSLEKISNLIDTSLKTLPIYEVPATILQDLSSKLGASSKITGR